MRMWIIIKYSIVGCFFTFLSCERNETKNLITDQPQRQIRSIIESTHDPIDNTGGLEFRPEISENSFITQSIFKDNGDPINIDRFDARGNLSSRLVHFYDEKENPIETVTYELSGVLGKRVNKFNTSNQLIESNAFDAYGKNISRRTIRFDREGNKVEVVYLLVNGAFFKTSESLYNEKGQNIENNHYSNKTLIHKEINRFDQQSNRIEARQFYPLKMEERITQFKYDGDNNITETVVLNSSLLVESKVTTTYDDKHQVVELFTFGITGNLKEHVKHQYEYDEVGNWTKEITFINNKPVSVRIRNIEYY